MTGLFIGRYVGLWWCFLANCQLRLRIEQRLKWPMVPLSASALAIALIFLPPNLRAQRSGSSGTKDAAVVLLVPELVFEKLRDESRLDPAKFGNADLARELSTAGQQYLRAKGFKITPPASIAPGAATCIAKLQPMAGRLARGSLTTELRAMLADLARQQGSVLIFAQFLRVRVGAKATYIEPISGQIRSGESQTVLATALIDPMAGTVVWKNEILVRKILRPDSKDFERSLSALYASF